MGFWMIPENFEILELMDVLQLIEKLTNKKILFLIDEYGALFNATDVQGRIKEDETFTRYSFTKIHS